MLAKKMPLNFTLLFRTNLLNFRLHSMINQSSHCRTPPLLPNLGCNAFFCFLEMSQFSPKAFWDEILNLWVQTDLSRSSGDTLKGNVPDHTSECSCIRKEYWLWSCIRECSNISISYIYPSVAILLRTDLQAVAVLVQVLQQRYCVLTAVSIHWAPSFGWFSHAAAWTFPHTWSL